MSTIQIDARPTRSPMTAAVRRSLWADVLLTGPCGVLLLAGAAVVDGPLGLPTGLLAGAGAILLVFVALVAVVARRPGVPTAVVGAIIAVNLTWALDSVILLGTGWVEPTALGVAFILFQAVVVLVLAAWQVIVLRRMLAGRRGS